MMSSLQGQLYAPVFKGKLQSHGFQVAIGTLTMCAVFDELFKLDLTKLDVEACVKAWPTLEQQ